MADLIELAKLSDVAREILVAARKADDSVVIASDQQGDFVFVGNAKSRGREHVAAVQDLCDDGYLRTPDGQLCELTGKGMGAADALQDPSIIEDLETIRLRKTVLDDLYRFHLRWGYNTLEKLDAQAHRLSLEPARLVAVWQYLGKTGAINVHPRVGNVLGAELTPKGIQICEAADRAALTEHKQESTTIIGEQVVIAAHDAHHIQRGTTNIQQEGVDLEAVARLIQAIRPLLLEEVTDPAEQQEALTDIGEIETAAKQRDAGALARARGALARLFSKVRPSADGLATAFTLYQMLEQLARAVGLA
jgi:hypothetical protein